MQNLIIRQPQRITEGRAMDAIFDGFRAVWRQPARRDQMLEGVSQAVQVRGYEVSVYASAGGVVYANVYAKGAQSPCATAECDEFDG